MAMGILGGMVTPVFLSQMHRQKMQVTLQNQERIFHALGAYLRIYGYLPCPVDPYNKKSGFLGARHCPLLASVQ